jgi:hypothetical protein
VDGSILSAINEKPKWLGIWLVGDCYVAKFLGNKRMEVATVWAEAEEA